MTSISISSPQTKIETTNSKDTPIAECYNPLRKAQKREPLQTLTSEKDTLPKNVTTKSQHIAKLDFQQELNEVQYHQKNENDVVTISFNNF